MLCDVCVLYVDGIMKREIKFLLMCLFCMYLGYEIW